jgi:hypothetical protein
MIFMCVDRYLSNVKFSQVKKTDYIRSKDENINRKDFLRNFDISYKPDGDSLMQNEDILRIAEEKEEAMRKKAKEEAKRRQAEEDRINSEKKLNPLAGIKGEEEDEDQYDSDDDRDEGALRVDTIKLQGAMASKYYFLWAQLIFVHLMIFFWLPFRGNTILHGSIDCFPQKASPEIMGTLPSNIPGLDEVECNKFTDNVALIIFYLLYCWVFYL